ncbi:MAG: hypothetical protein HC897_02820, partial [Thermoanaerobaculia bacterium]|nr:hypothetical protein [Thermoanaerobaculia bacterium]
MIDVTEPTAPRLLGSIETPGNARGVDASGSVVLVADGPGGVHVIDVANPTAPVILGTVGTRATFSSAAAIAVRDRLAYVADGSDRTLGGLRVVDWSDPLTPALIASTDDGFGLTAVALDRNVALAADFFFVNAVPVFDLRELAPTPRGHLDFSGGPRFRDDNGNDLAVQGGLVYLVAARSEILDNGVTGNTGLHIGRYAIQEDLAG